MNIRKIILTTLFLCIIILIPFRTTAEFSIILNFDDGYKGVYDNAFPVMKKHNIPGVVFVITKELNDKNHITVEELKGMKANAWEIGSHTICHYNLEETFPQVREHEITGSLKHLFDHGLVSSSYASFCSPRGKWNKEIAQIVSTSYQMARGEELWYFNNQKKYRVEKVIPRVILKKTRINAVKGWIKEARDEDKPLILVFHEIANGGNQYYYPIDKFEKLIELIKDYKVITYRQLYDSITKSPKNRE